MKCLQVIFALLLFQSASCIVVAADPVQKPLFRDFMGICGHTVLFKPKLYAATCRLARDYHNLDWDVGEETDYWPRFPFARNNVNWEQVYGDWKKEGFDTDVCVQFGYSKKEKWANIERDSHTYGFSLARFFGPNGRKLISSIEIGNEPGLYDDETYRTVFKNMAAGIRVGDSNVLIATCAMTTGKSGQYAKSVECFQGLESLYDVLNLHTYAEIEGWPTWRRSFPEDPGIKYLTNIAEIVNWRNQHAPGKQIWVTEFGYDASTKKAPEAGDFKKWIGSTETQQAQYLVRSFLVFSTLDINRAYIFFFNDDDEPHVHGSSGLTRRFEPKPAFYAVAHLYKMLGEYRFSQVLTATQNDLFVYEFASGTDPSDHVLVAWSPTGSEISSDKSIPIGKNEVIKVERMPLKAGAAESVPWKKASPDSITLTVTESPAYIRLKAP